jgi:hypothetical protein
LRCLWLSELKFQTKVTGKNDRNLDIVDSTVLGKVRSTKLPVLEPFGHFGEKSGTPVLALFVSVVWTEQDVATEATLSSLARCHVSC